MKLGGIAKVKQPLDLKKVINSVKNTSAKKRKNFILYTLSGFVLIIVLMFVISLKDLPTSAKLASLHAADSTKILDRNGKLLYETGEQKRTVIDQKDMPTNLRNAVVSAEDANFFKHNGIDFRGIGRAALSDIFNFNSSQGGSTITQQFVKNAILTNKKTFSRKIREAILAIEIEQLYSKEEILTLYLNEIPYGGNIYGVEQASQTYFGKSAKDLTLSEAATIASIPKAPTYYSPYGTHTDKLFIRKDYVLDRMSELGYITKEEALIAKAESPKKDKPEFKQKRESILAPHFVMYVKEKLVDQYGEKAVNSGGLTVQTTLDLDKQKAADEAIQNGSKKLDRYGATNAALVTVNVKTGEIEAMVGGKDYFDMENGGNVNVVDSARQPGSSFKPIVYATAFKNARFSPGFNLFDLSTDFGGYKPNNYDGSNRGPVTIRTALANSLNIPAVKMLALVGVPEALKTAKDIGITTLNQPDRYGLSLVLGGGEVKPLEMAGAFSSFADSGKYHKPTSILKITDHKNNTLYEFKPETNKFNALDPQIAYQITDILSDNNARCMVFGCQNALNFGDKQVAAKTGTTQEFHDAWTVGYNTQYATAVWVGNNDNKKMNNGADGSVVAAPIFHDFMDRYTGDQKFERPAGIQELTVEKYSCKLPTENSKEFTKDIFASWQIPTEKDDINVAMRVNRVTGLLATDSTPAELIEERNFTNLHNEWGPNWNKYPNWEGPIRRWAEERGMYLSVPSENDNSYSQRPTISILSPKNGATISATTSVTVSTNSKFNISKIEFYVDDSLASAATSSPFIGSVDPSKYSNGQHRLTAKLYDENNVSAETSITINITNAPKLSISNVNIEKISNTQVNISFNTNLASSSSISYGTNNTNLNLSKKGSSGTTSHLISITGLDANSSYFYKITVEALSQQATDDGKLK